ncbi:hypothetical protein GCM10017688_28220 [Streptomyces ramulosus]
MAEFFENFEAPEGVRAELLRGEILLTAGLDLVHNGIVEDTMDRIPRRRWHRVQTQDVGIPGEHSQPVPDLVVLERGAGPRAGRLLPAEAVTMLVEVVSRTSVDLRGPADQQVRRAGAAGGTWHRAGNQGFRHAPAAQAAPPTVTKSISSSTRPSSAGSTSL